MLLLLLLVSSLAATPAVTSIEVAQVDYPNKLATYIDLKDAEKIEIGAAYLVKVNVEIQQEGNYVLTCGNWYMRNQSFFDADFNLIGSGHNTSLQLNQGTNTYYIFYPFPDEKDKSLFSPNIHKEIDFITLQFSVRTKQLLFQAILIFLIFVALFFGISSRESIYFFYSLYLFFLGMFFAYQYGLLGSVFPIVDKVPMMWFWLPGSFITLFYLFFSERLLDVRNTDKVAYNTLRLGIAYIILVTFSSMILYLLKIDVQQNHWYKTPILIFQTGFILVYLYRILSFPGIIKTYFLASSFILFVVSIAGQLNSTMQLSYDYNDFAQPALISEVFILCLGLGVRVYQIQKSKNQVQKQLISELRDKKEIQEKYARELEDKVTARTKLLDERNKENELLLKEIHHRVKNNLQMITSLINMQERRVSNEAKEAFNSTRNKIKSIALMHEHLYQNERLSRIRLRSYIQELAEMLVSTSSNREVQVDLQISDTEVDYEHVIQIGIIINELVTNSLKYAVWSVPKPQIRIVFDLGDMGTTIKVCDNGNGVPELISKKGLGFSIIESIAMSYDGELLFNRSGDWFEAIVKLGILHKENAA